MKRKDALRLRLYDNTIFDDLIQRFIHQDPARDLRELIPHAPDDQTRRMMEEIARKMER